MTVCPHLSVDYIKFTSYTSKCMVGNNPLSMMFAMIIGHIIHRVICLLRQSSCELGIHILHEFLLERLIVLGSAIPMPKAYANGDPNTYKAAIS